MNMDIKITLKIEEIAQNGIRGSLYYNKVLVDCFIIDVQKKEIISSLTHDTRYQLSMENIYEDYVKLIIGLGYINFEIPEEFKKHWTPNPQSTYYFINRLGEVVSDTNIDSPVQVGTLENYNAFPTYTLAEKSINLSKLGRLILLWQCTNNCIFEPNWEDENQYKYYIVYYNDRQKLDWHFDDSTNFNTQYFATKEQIEAFIEMYRTEIKKLMNIN